MAGHSTRASLLTAGHSTGSTVGDAALQAGNSEAVIRKHYLDLKTEEEADQFWRVMPEGMKLPKKIEKKDGVWVEATAKQKAQKE